MWRRLVWMVVALLVVTGGLVGMTAARGRAPAVEAVPAPPTPAPVDAIAQEPPEAPPAPPEVLVPYDGPVEHIFFHPLIIYPELAFDGDGLSRGYDDWFVTVPEFSRIVAALYQRGYILVDLASLFEESTKDGRTVMVRKPLQLPPGKKPLVLSIDDLNYYEYMRANGNAHRLIVDEDGRIKTVSRTPGGETVISAENEIIPLLDSFVMQHPDFSYRGAKGVIALTGYEGILGYRTDRLADVGLDAERQAALTVVRRLKETGWSFASHGWGHLDAAKLSRETLARDTRRWKTEVEPLIGPTQIYIYPFGSGVAPGDARFRLLQDEGFRIFCGVGPQPFLQVQDGYVRMDRRHIDGMAFRTMSRQLLPLFDANEILDPIRPKPKGP
ncbi:MAG TPA: polysaccharide deacetylase family protein [Symbiobacteriaceae bacterium]|nr:polysaccharide deacetylase family protein [Symbiobacteriaceae bacterium]